MDKVRIGVIGCGSVSGQYFAMAGKFPFLEIVACADTIEERARQRASKFGIGRVCSVDQMLDDPTVELVLNLTVPKAHVGVTIACLQAGKHVYVEKPLATSREDGRRVMELARGQGLLVGCAPDTFLGSGIQTARKLIEDGAIGRPVAFTAFMMCPGHESWHPNPEFYYEIGGGPMLDMGPYYLTALLQMLGGVRRLTASATVAIPQRTITHRDRQGNPGAKFGKPIEVQTPDHICGTMDFENGCAGVIVQTFATHFAPIDGKQPVTIFGTEGTLKVGDPNQFDGPVSLRRVGEEQFADVPPKFATGYGRGIGAADMAMAIRTGRPFRASGSQAMYVLDLMIGFLDAAENGRAFEPAQKYEKPAAMRADLPFGTLE